MIKAMIITFVAYIALMYTCEQECLHSCDTYTTPVYDRRNREYWNDYRTQWYEFQELCEYGDVPGLNGSR